MALLTEYCGLRKVYPLYSVLSNDSLVLPGPGYATWPRYFFVSLNGIGYSFEMRKETSVTPPDNSNGFETRVHPVVEAQLQTI